jgi:hypothetical protein
VGEVLETTGCRVTSARGVDGGWDKCREGPGPVPMGREGEGAVL